MPRCRSVEAPYFDDEYSDLFNDGEVRAARNPETGKTEYVPADMKYKEWKERFVDNDQFTNEVESGITKENNVESKNCEVHIVGKIDKDIYSCITNDIVTDDVIITDERINHIKERHPNDYEKHYVYMKDIVEKPDYILGGNKINSALVLKEFSKGNEKFKMVLKLITSNDDVKFKNSIITFMKINNKEWERLLRNKEILYKKE